MTSARCLPLSIAKPRQERSRGTLTQQPNQFLTKQTERRGIPDEHPVAGDPYLSRGGFEFHQVQEIGTVFNVWVHHFERHPFHFSGLALVIASVYSNTSCTYVLADGVPHC